MGGTSRPPTMRKDEDTIGSGLVCLSGFNPRCLDSVHKILDHFEHRAFAEEELLVDHLAGYVVKETIGTTDGNLSASLSKLEDAGYISIKKGFKGKKPLTTCRISKKGAKAFSEYLKALESYIEFKE